MAIFPVFINQKVARIKIVAHNLELYIEFSSVPILRRKIITNRSMTIVDVLIYIKDMHSQYNSMKCVEQRSITLSLHEALKDLDKHPSIYIFLILKIIPSTQ